MNRDIYYYAKVKMCNRGKFFGIAALACAFIFPTVPYISIVLGATAVIFAILSRGEDIRYSKDAKVALSTGLSAIIICIVVFGSVFVALKANDEYRHNVGEYMDELYGTMYSEEMGESFSDILDDFFAEGSD